MTERLPSSVARQAALRELSAVVRDIAGLPGERDAGWWAGVRAAICAHHGVESLAYGRTEGP